MTFNKYFVFAPKALEEGTQQNTEWTSDKETQRQAMVKQAQQQGGC
ncbi:MULTISPECIES: hypothetical protein [Vibrio]|nr:MULTISPECIES: hypothetical protein [Vibrio]